MNSQILIVDDDIETIRVLGLMLERKGYTILAAASGNQGFEKAIQTQPDLIIMDVMMPDMDGYQVTQRLRKNPKTAAIPILMFTAKGSFFDRISGMQAGADEYLSKPIYPKELLKRVEALLSHQNASAPVAEAIGGRVIGILAVQKGLGGSTLALNAAVTLTQVQQEKKTLLVETVAAPEGLAAQLGLETRQGLAALLAVKPGDLNTDAIEKQILAHHSGIACLLNAAPPDGETPTLAPDWVTALLQQLRARYDYTLLDLGSAITANNTEFVKQLDFIALALESTYIGLTLLQDVLKTLNTLGISDKKTALISVQRQPETTLSRETLEGNTRRKVLGNIAYDPELARDCRKAHIPAALLQPQSLVAQQVRQLVEALLNQL